MAIKYFYGWGSSREELTVLRVPELQLVSALFLTFASSWVEQLWSSREGEEEVS